MSRYMLDTHMCIDLNKHQPESVARKFAQCRVEEVIMSAITFAELDDGVAACANPEREANLLAALTRRIKAAPFDEKSAAAYGAVRLATRERKSDHLDKLIAAHAISLNIVLVTNNTRDFSAYPGLVLEKMPALRMYAGMFNTASSMTGLLQPSVRSATGAGAGSTTGTAVTGGSTSGASETATGASSWSSSTLGWRFPESHHVADTDDDPCVHEQHACQRRDVCQPVEHLTGQACTACVSRTQGRVDAQKPQSVGA